MSASTPPTLRLVIAEAIFRRKAVVLGTWAIVSGLALVGSLAMHKKYEAHAKLLVQNVRSAAQLTTNSVDHLVSQGDVSQAEINTEVDLLESEGVARRALFGASPKLAPAGETKALTRFKRFLSVQAVHQTDVINLTMLGDSPQKAEGSLQGLIDAYFEERAGTARNSGAAEFFTSQLQQKAKQLDADQEALTGFEMQHGIADLDDQTKLQVTRLSALQDEVSQVEAALAAQQGKVAAEQRELAITPVRSKTQIRTITNQYSQERLNTSLVDLQNRRTELLARYVPSDRQIIEIDDKIATTRRAINDASVHPAGEEATDVNPVWSQLSTLAATSASEISGLQEKRNALGQQIGAARQRLQELEASTAGYGDLRRRLQQSQADYALYAQRRDEARISEALDRQKLFNVAVLQSVSSSTDPVRPRPLLYVATACVFGMLLGICFAVYADLASGQAHTPSQLDTWTGVRTLATFADETEGPWTRSVNRLQYRRVLFGVRQSLRREQTSSYPGSQTTLFPTRGHGDGQGMCIAFTSALRGEGVSFLVNNLATEAAQQASQRVAVLDTRDLLNRFEQGAAEHLPMEFQAGGEHWVLAKSAPAGNASKLAKDHGSRGQFVPHLGLVLQQARREYDLVLLDCPSLQNSMLAGELAPCIDGYVAVVKAGAARKHNVEDLAWQLASTHTPTLGYVLTQRHYPVPRWLHRLI